MCKNVLKELRYKIHTGKNVTFKTYFYYYINDMTLTP